MNTILSIARRAALAFFAALTLTLVFGAAPQAVQAQLRPFVDCVERVDNSNYRVYFGYVSLYSGVVKYQPDSPDNYFTPIPDPPGQQSSFLPGIHRRVVSVIVPNNTSETWVLEENFVNSFGQTLFPCADAGGNTRTITYQGRLTDANAVANGRYDLRFQLFNQAANGASQSAALEFDSVAVVNGVFTVQLDFGLLPALLEGGNLFMEIGVRPGAATGGDPYTTLAPRQPLTATPYAIRAQSAANADLLNGLSADKFIRNGTQGQSANFNIFGNGAINGSLTVTSGINGTATNATNAVNVSGGYVQLPLTTGAPPASECNAASQYGRQKVDAANVRLYICTAAGWKSTVLQ